MSTTQKILIFDFGGQYTQLIARRVRECHVYSEVVPWSIPVEEVRKQQPVGIILSGGPSTVHDENAPIIDPELYALGIPVLGICYGMQLTAHLLGGRVEKAKEREYGRIVVKMKESSAMFAGMKSSSFCWMSHTWQVASCPEGFEPVARTDNCPVAAMANEERRIYGVQFHPEVTHTEEGRLLLHNFLFNICRCTGDWTMEAYAEQAVRQIREITGGDGKVLLGLSGGVDSSVAAALIFRAIGDRLTCVFVDHGLLRKGESDQVCDVFSNLFPVRFIRVDASERFFTDLKGVTEPEEKRHIIGRDFIEVFRDEAKKLGKPTVACIVAGRNVIIDSKDFEDWNSVVMCYLPGSEGKGISDVLCGCADFEGKLPSPWYSSIDQIGTGKSFLERGYGLSYGDGFRPKKEPETN